MKEKIQQYEVIADQINVIGYSDNELAARKAKEAADLARKQGDTVFADFFDGLADRCRSGLAGMDPDHPGILDATFLFPFRLFNSVDRNSVSLQ